MKVVDAGGQLKKAVPPAYLHFISSTSELAQKHGFPLYLVGGFVRDLLLRIPNLDLDFVVEGNGMEFAKILADTTGGSLVTYPRFCTATVFYKSRNLNLENDLRVDFSSARKETYPQPAILPQVTLSSVQEDMRRRDFTINALSIKLNPGAFGILYDFCGGLQDLKKKKLRILHEKSFVDDPTRIFRSVRFKNRFRFYMDAYSIKRMKEAVEGKTIERLSGERLRNELVLLFSEKSAAVSFRDLQKRGVFPHIYPGFGTAPAVKNYFSRLERVIRWYEKNVKDSSLQVWLLFFAGACSHQTPRHLQKLAHRLRFSRQERKLLLSFYEARVRWLQKRKPLQSFLALKKYPPETCLYLMSASSSRKAVREVKNFLLFQKDVKLDITGADLLNLGYAPGPHFKKVLSYVLEAKVKGKVKTREEQLALAKKHLARQSA